MNLNQFICRSFVLLSITISSMASASPTPLDTRWLQGQVLADATAATKVLDKEYVVYHWVKREYVSAPNQLPRRGYFSPTDPNIQTFVQSNMQSRMDLFWDLSTRITGRNADGRPMAPNGLYVAINPVISKQWGDTLYQMTLKNGMRYVDGRSYRTFGGALQNALRSKGCQYTTMRDLSKSDTNELACRQALAEIAQATGSAGVMYHFNREPLPNCEQWSPAIVMISLDGIKEGTIAPMSPPDVPETDDGLNYVRAVVNGMFRLSAQTGVLNHQSPFRSSPILPNLDEATIRQYAATHYIGCKTENMPRR